LEFVGITEDKYTDALVALDKLDKIGADGVYKELIDRGIKDDNAIRMSGLFEDLAKVNQENVQTLIDLEKNLNESPLGMTAIADLKRIIEYSENASLKIDASLARGLSYYTGAIFEINVSDLAGSLGGGGRYDGLIGMFGKEQIPACGFSLGLERILVVMNERGMFPKELETNAADVVVTIWNADSIGESLKLASELRNAGLRVLVYPEADKLGKQFKYAAQINAAFVCVVGETELAENTVTLKNLTTGEQQTVARAEIAAKLKG
jgi:histidyl-tRNA synthetase